MFEHGCEEGKKWSVFRDRFLGRGTRGNVYNTCKAGSCTYPCPYATRVERIFLPSQLETLSKALQIQNKMANAGLSPQVYDTWVCREPASEFDSSTENKNCFREEGEGLESLEESNEPPYLPRSEENALVKGEPTAFAVMDYLTGQSLDKVIAKRDLSSSEKKKLRQAIARMHALGILHKDLGADNIILGEDGSWRIIDFGTSEQHTPGSLTQAQKLQDIAGLSFFRKPSRIPSTHRSLISYSLPFRKEKGQ